MANQLSSILHRFDFLSEGFWKIGSIIRFLPNWTLLINCKWRWSCGRLRCREWFSIDQRQEMSSFGKAMTFKIAARDSVSLLAALFIHLKKNRLYRRGNLPNWASLNHLYIKLLAAAVQKFLSFSLLFWRLLSDLQELLDHLWVVMILLAQPEKWRLFRRRLVLFTIHINIRSYNFKINWSSLNSTVLFLRRKWLKLNAFLADLYLIIGRVARF